MASVERPPPSAAILWPGYNSAKYMFDHVPLWLCEDITACCYMYCYFRNISEEVLQPGDGLVDCTSKESEELKEFVSASEIPVSLTREALISAQKRDSSLSKCFAAVEGGDCKGLQSFCVDDGVLMRKWVSRMGKSSDDSIEDWSTVQHLVVPIDCRQQVLELAHEHLWSGHLRVTKTYDRMLKHFFWPGMKADVRHFCNTCRTCQIVGKPNQVVQSCRGRLVSHRHGNHRKRRCRLACGAH